jgi:hypothetical protein
MAGFDLGDYVTVPQREALFYKNHPDGRIVASTPEIRTIGDRIFIEVTASVFRSPEDLLPCVASAWEPFPGRTPYTKDSEMMNAETSAIGRALAAAGIAVNRSLASAEEVRNRQAERDVPSEPPVKAKPKAAKLAIDDLVSRMNALVPAEIRVEAKSSFSEKFGHPSKLSSDDLEAAILFVAEWEDRADAPKEKTPHFKP